MNDALKQNQVNTATRLDYTWKYFESAAHRRTQLLNFFFIIVGILASGYGLAMDRGFVPLAIGIATYGVVTCCAFIVFDYRMLVFVRRALDVLDYLEQEEVFPDNYGPTDQNGRVQQLGLARIEAAAKRAMERSHSSGAWYTKTSTWQRVAIQGFAALGFILAIIYGIMHLGTAESCVLDATALIERIEGLEEAVDIIKADATRMPMEDVFAPTQNVDGAPQR